VHGLERVREPYVKHLEGPLWEMRLKGKDGIARAAYVTRTGQRVVVVHMLVKKSQKDAALGNRDGPGAGRGGDVTRKRTTAHELHEAWSKDPGYVKAYDALEEELALAEAFIRARAQADLTQEQVAQCRRSSPDWRAGG
jgi:hypothetical protein